MSQSVQQYQTRITAFTTKSVEALKTENLAPTARVQAALNCLKSISTKHFKKNNFKISKNFNFFEFFRSEYK